MESGFSLIERATDACGSRYKLAQTIQEDLSFLGKLAKGTRPMSPGIAAKLAAIAGVDPRTAALIAIVSQEKDPAERSKLAQLLSVDISDSAGPLCIM